VPDLGLEAHDGWPEGIFTGDLDVYVECAALVRCVWRAVELAFEVCEVIAISCGLDNNLGELVLSYVGNLFGNPPGPIGRSHCVELRRWRECLKEEKRARRSVVQDRQRAVDLSSGQPEAPEAPAAAGSESRVLVNWRLDG